MLIDCVLRTWFKKKGQEDKMFYEVPLYQIQHYVEDPAYDVKYALQIVNFDEDGDLCMVLAEKVFVPDGKTTHHIHYFTANYSYDEAKNIIYTQQTKRKI